MLLAVRLLGGLLGVGLLAVGLLGVRLLRVGLLGVLLLGVGLLGALARARGGPAEVQHTLRTFGCG